MTAAASYVRLGPAALACLAGVLYKYSFLATYRELIAAVQGDFDCLKGPVDQPRTLFCALLRRSLISTGFRVGVSL